MTRILPVGSKTVLALVRSAATFLFRAQVHQLVAFAFVVAVAGAAASVVLTTSDSLAFEQESMSIVARSMQSQRVLGDITRTPSPIRVPGVIQGYRMAPSGQPVPDAAIITNAGTYDASVNPYTASVTPGVQLVSSTQPAGYDVYYSICNNCTDHPDNSYTLGTSAVVTVTSGGYVDVWWKYVAQGSGVVNGALVVVVNKNSIVPGESYVLTGLQGDQKLSGAVDVEYSVCSLEQTQCAPAGVLAPWPGVVFNGGSAVVPTTIEIPLGIYKARIRPAGQTAVPWSNYFTITVAKPSALVVDVNGSSTATTRPGGGYVLTAKQNGKNYIGQLEAQLDVCQLGNPVQCAPTVVNVWSGYTIVNNQYQVVLPTTFAPGIYKARFRPVGQTTIPWSNPITVTVELLPVQDGYVDVISSVGIAGWFFDNSSAEVSSVTITIQKANDTSKSPTVFTKVVEATVLRNDAAAWLQANHAGVTVPQPPQLGFAVDPRSFIDRSGTYTVKSVVTRGGYALDINPNTQNKFTISAAPVRQLTISVSATPTTTQASTVSVPAGTSYVLTAKQGTAPYTAQPRTLDYQAVVCDVNGANCGAQTTGAWIDTPLDANGQVTAQLGNAPAGTYKAKFRPRGKTDWQWSNEVVVTVTRNQIAPVSKLYGVHSALEWKTFYAQDEHIDKLKELGVQVSRNGVFWQMIEPVKGQRNWTLTDKWVNDLSAAGIKPLISILGSASWANGTTVSNTSNYMMVVPTDEAAFTQWVEEYRNYVHEMVVRYKDKVKLWELWNEPNWSEFWLPAPNPERYVRWAQAMEQEIKSVQPDAQVAYAGLTVLDGYSAMTARDITGKDYLQAMYNAGARPDIISLHPYALTNVAPDQYTAGDGISTFRDVETIRDVMTANGQSNKQIWLTEFGWDADAVTETTKANYLTRAFQIIRDQWPYVTLATWYLDWLGAPIITPTATSGYGLMRTDGTFTPAGLAFKNFMGVPTRIQDGYVDASNNRNIAGWSYDSVAGSTGQSVIITVENVSNLTQTYTLTAQPQIVTPQAEASAKAYLQQQYGQNISVISPLGFSVDPSNYITTPGTYRIRSVVTNGGYQIELSSAAKQPFIIGPTQPNQLTISVSATPTTTQASTVSVPTGTSYVLTAKQGTAPYTAQPRTLDYQAVVCEVNGANCGAQTTGAWIDTPLDANGQVTAQLGNAPAGTYKAKFRPRGKTDWQWSNEVAVRVTSFVTVNPNYNRIINASAGGFSYAYGPAIIKENGTYHLFFCSLPGADGGYGWDAIRYSSSTDGVNWTSPVVKVAIRGTSTVNGMVENYAACDPNVVYYKGYYYLYYSNAYKNQNEGILTMINVARSSTIDGQYAVYTADGAWVVDASNPKILVYPAVAVPAVSGRIQPAYGAGQQIVVARGDKLYMWYTDDSSNPDAGAAQAMWLRISDDPVMWMDKPAQRTPLLFGSGDIAYSSTLGQFIYVGASGQHTPGAALITSRSIDGISWVPLREAISASSFPDYANNIGVERDKNGGVGATDPLVGFGAPPGLRSNDVWGQWDLYGVVVPGLFQ